MKIKSIIIEDEKSNRENLAKILSEYCPKVEVVAMCASAIDGRKAISEFQPDLVFLDIEMPGGSGFSLLESIEEINFEVISLSPTTAKIKMNAKALGLPKITGEAETVILELTKNYKAEPFSAFWK